MGVITDGDEDLDGDDGLAKFDLIPPAKVISFDVCLWQPLLGLVYIQILPVLFTMFKFSKAQNFLVIKLWKILSIPPDPHPPFVFDRVVRCLLPPPPYRIKKDLLSY